eukprot:1186315-Prorocentrum_minimum.AAC.2
MCTPSWRPRRTAPTSRCADVKLHSRAARRRLERELPGPCRVDRWVARCLHPTAAWALRLAATDSDQTSPAARGRTLWRTLWLPLWRTPWLTLWRTLWRTLWLTRVADCCRRSSSGRRRRGPRCRSEWTAGWPRRQTRAAKGTRAPASSSYRCARAPCALSVQAYPGRDPARKIASKIARYRVESGEIAAISFGRSRRGGRPLYVLTPALRCCRRRRRRRIRRFQHRRARYDDHSEYVRRVGGAGGLFQELEAFKAEVEHRCSSDATMVRASTATAACGSGCDCGVAGGFGCGCVTVTVTVTLPLLARAPLQGGSTALLL